MQLKEMMMCFLLQNTVFPNIPCFLLQMIGKKSTFVNWPNASNWRTVQMSSSFDKLYVFSSNKCYLDGQLDTNVTVR